MPGSGSLDFGPFERLFGLTLSASQQAQTRLYLERLRKWGRVINLSGRRSTEEWLRLDFFESFWLADHLLAAEERLLDVGSGAGFPGLAVKIRRPGLEVVLIEPRLKRMVFLEETARALSLEVCFFRGRGEAYPGYRAGDLVSVRALSPGAELVECWRRNRVRLVCLHGDVLPEGLRGWQTIQRAQVPGSQRRFASLLV